MKISHWVIIGSIIMLVFCLTWGMKYQLLWKLNFTETCYNQITDNALEDGLMAGTTESSFSVPVIDEVQAVKGFKKSLLKGFDLTEESPGGKRMLECISCIIILQNEYYSVITQEGREQYPYEVQYGDWVIQFSMEGNVRCRNSKTLKMYEGTEESIRELVGYDSDDVGNKTINSWRQQVVTDCVEETMEDVLKEQIKGKNYRIDFPQIREDACHTLEGISMLAFLQYGEYDLDGLQCNRYVLSGARVMTE